MLAARLSCGQRRGDDAARRLRRRPRCCRSLASTTGAPACAPVAATACSDPTALSCTCKHARLLPAQAEAGSGATSAAAAAEPDVRPRRPGQLSLLMPPAM